MPDDDASSIVASRVRAVASAFFRFRAALVPPAALAAWLVARAQNAPARQLGAMAFGMSATSLFFLYESRRATRAMSERRLAVSLLVTLLALGAAAFVTGGLASPMIPVLFAPTITAFAAFGKRRASVVMLVVFVVVIAALFALAPVNPFAAIGNGARPALAALFSLVTASLLWSSVAGLADAYTRAATEVYALRDDAVALVIERSRTLDAVGSKVAHEIKNPLAAIKGLVQLLRRQASDEQSERRLEVIERESDRIDAVLRDYLTFARPLDALALEPLAIDSLVDHVLAVLDPRARRAEVALVRGDVTATQVLGDRRKLEAALVNLGINAIDASPRGSSVTFEALDAAERVTVVVRDEGRGMDAATLARVGTPFFTTSAEGTGLGVAIAKSTVEQHGGTLSFTCPTTGGTTVAVNLPTREARAR
ncbi:MAG: HAMP domain-containing histidine kinase [Myxococcales bacterium]|nr:HAMP domain-containing histidine kinase [Myxococcales bacterium]